MKNIYAFFVIYVWFLNLIDFILFVLAPWAAVIETTFIILALNINIKLRSGVLKVCLRFILFLIYFSLYKNNTELVYITLKLFEAFFCNCLAVSHGTIIYNQYIPKYNKSCLFFQREIALVRLWLCVYSVLFLFIAFLIIVGVTVITSVGYHNTDHQHEKRKFILIIIECAISEGMSLMYCWKKIY